MDEGPINTLLNTRNEDFIYQNDNVDNDFLYRPEFKQVAQLDLGMNVGGLKGVTDFEQFDNLNKQKKLQGQTIDQTITGDPEQQEGDENNDLDDTRNSDVYGTIAPALEVENKVKELQKKREEVERAKAEKAAKLAQLAETGEDDGLTNVPLDILFKQKLEEKIVESMGAAPK